MDDDALGSQNLFMDGLRGAAWGRGARGLAVGGVAAPRSGGTRAMMADERLILQMVDLIAVDQWRMMILVDHELVLNG